MVKNNEYIIPKENYKKTEEVREIDYKVPSYEEFMHNYNADEKIIDSYSDEVRSYGNLGERRACGPMYNVSSDYTTSFSIKYKLDHSGGNWKNYFEQSGNYSNRWEMSGSLEDIKKEQWRLEDGEIKVVMLNSRGNYERNKSKEEEIKDQLRRDVRKFELWRCGNPERIEREFKDMIQYTLEYTKPTIYACPTQTPQTRINKK